MVEYIVATIINTNTLFILNVVQFSTQANVNDADQIVIMVSILFGGLYLPV